MPTRTSPISPTLAPDRSRAVIETVVPTAGTPSPALRRPALRRFDGYADRYAAALREVDAGRRWCFDAPDRESCHLVRIQFHETCSPPSASPAARTPPAG